MPTINTYDKPDMSRLAFAQTDPLANLVYNQAFPAMDALTEAGKFREVNARTHFLKLDTVSSKFTTPNMYNYSDAFRYFKNAPISAGFEFSNADLKQPSAYGYASRGAMIESRMRWMTNLLKKQKETALYTFVSNNNNFEGATYYANAATAWSTVGTADPLSDVEAGRLIVPELNAGIMSYTAFRYCTRMATIKGSTTVSGAMRDGSVDPTITLEFLKNYLQLQYLWIARGDTIDDSDVAATETRTEIWGDKMLLFYHNPTPGPEEPSWMKHLFWKTTDSTESSEGWLVTETQDPEVGGAGVTRWGIWNYYQFLLHEASLAYRIDNLY